MSNQATPAENLKRYARYFKLDVYSLNECFLLIESISNRSEVINKTRYANPVGRIQQLLISNLILTIAKFFDKPSSKYDTVSIPSILQVLEEFKEELKIYSISDCMGKLSKAGVNSRDNNDLDGANLVNHIVSCFQVKLDEQNDVIEKIKFHRDKVIAHNEIIDLKESKDLNWGEVKNLMELIHNFCEAVNLCFLDIPASLNDLKGAKESFNDLLDLIVGSE